MQRPAFQLTAILKAFQITQCDDASGRKFYTIAFIIADKRNNPAWDGRIPMDKNLYADQINAIRSRGGDVIVSFGGAGGTEFAKQRRHKMALACFDQPSTRDPQFADALVMKGPRMPERPLAASVWPIPRVDHLAEEKCRIVAEAGAT